jgi:hypothetical protein
MPERPPIRINECHDFAWSRDLWRAAATSTARVAMALIIIYLLVGFYCLARLDGMSVLDSWYFLAATLTTVGIGDYAPTKQVTRALACFLIPFGLVVVSMCISYAQALALSSGTSKDSKDPKKEHAHPHPHPHPPGSNRKHEPEAAKMKMLSDEEAATDAATDAVDWRGGGGPSIRAQYAMLSLRFAGVIAIGALFFLANAPERRGQEKLADSYEDKTARERFSVVDALFFSVVISTTGKGGVAKACLFFHLLTFVKVCMGTLFQRRRSLCSLRSHSGLRPPDLAGDGWRQGLPHILHVLRHGHRRRHHQRRVHHLPRAGRGGENYRHHFGLDHLVSDEGM